MSLSRLTPVERRRLRWRRLLERRSLVRHPVSLTRERVGTVVLVFLSLGLVWYAWIARDASIHRRAVDFLTEATSGEVEVAEAQFTMFGGITLRGVSVAVPFSEELDASAVDKQSREIFRADMVRLVHDPWALLFGRLRVEKVVAANPTIILAHNVETGVRNWQLLSRVQGESSSSRGSTVRPIIKLRSAKAIAVSITKGGGRVAEEEWLDVDIHPHPQAKTGFSIEIRRFSEPAERTTVIFDPGQHLVTNTPFVDAKKIRLQLPKAAQLFLDRISLQGEAKLSRLVYSEQAIERRDTELRLRNVQCEFPLSMLRSGAGGVEALSATSQIGEDRVIKMTAVKGYLNLRDDKLELRFSGMVNGAECRLTGHLDRVSGSFDQMGIDLELRGTKIPAPDEIFRQELIGDPSVPKGLRNFLKDYSPAGAFDIDFRFARQPGESRQMTLAGTIKPQGASGRYRLFPYTVHDLHGQVRFEDKHVYLEDLRGRHGSAVIATNGTIDRTVFPAAATLDFLGTSVSLDEDLFKALAPRYQSIWQQFNPQGSARISVHLERVQDDEGNATPQWKSRIVADLVDSELMFHAFPYPLTQVTGRLEIEGSRFKFDKLTGHHGKAIVQLDGHAIFHPNQTPEVELRVEAKSIPLDEALEKALPPEARTAFTKFRPSGFVNLSGTVSLHPDNPGVVYDLHANLYDTSVKYEYFPYALNDIQGSISIRPEGLSVIEITGKHGQARITATGSVHRLNDGFVTDLHFEADALALEPNLYQALPRSMQKVWDSLDPTGSIRVSTSMHHESRGGQVSQRHRAELFAEGCKIRFKGFPLPLSNVSAHVLMNDRQIEILTLGGKSGDGTIEIKGNIDISEPGKRGTLTVTAEEMAFSDDLLAAMPDGLRSVLSPMRPSGRFDLCLDPLIFDTDAEGKTHWDFAGELSMDNVHAKIGVDVKKANGEMRATGEISRDGRVRMAAEASLRQAEVAGWLFDNAYVDIELDPISRTMTLDNLSSGVYGGELIGMAKVVFRDNHADYQASFNVRDLQLSQYLDLHASLNGASEEKKQTSQGSVNGNLVLRGRTGSHGFREGTGEVFVRDAQVWKLPLVMAIFQVLNLTPDENVFHDGWLNYYVSGDTLTFQKIDLQGKAISFVGAGKMSLKTRQLDVTLLAGSPVRIRVPFLTDILEGASREIMEVRLTGTLDKPKITPQPLKSLTRVLKTLFPLSQDQDASESSTR